MNDQSSARKEALAGLPVTDRRLELAGIRTALVEGGRGAPVVLLHGPAGNASHWLRVIPELATTHHVVAPDLPGQGASEVTGGSLDADRVLDWLGELIESTCASPPVVVGVTLGGAIAACFAADQGDRIDSLVLVDALGLTGFAPTPEFGLALNEFIAQPDARSHDGLWRVCAFDLDRLREGMGESWTSLRTYNLDRAATPSVMAGLGALMQEFGMQAIPPEVLEKITVPTTLVWGRHDLASSLEVAEAASARYGWPLQVIEASADEPPIEQPEAFLRALRAAIESPAEVSA